jgi:hypothetical protein
MDVFIEQIIKKKMGAKDYLIYAAIILGGCLLVFASMLVIPGFSFLILVGVCFGAYYLITSRNLEFEYSVTNGDITVDKIINRRKRKRMITTDAHDIEEMGKYKAEEHTAKNYSERLFTSEQDDGSGAWYFVTRHPQKGSVLVVFSPNETTLTAIKPFLSRQVATHVFGRN